MINVVKYLYLFYFQRVAIFSLDVDHTVSEIYTGVFQILCIDVLFDVLHQMYHPENHMNMYACELIFSVHQMGRDGIHGTM